jgi:glycosyltransferase involved in cell wall biosynthesis
MQLSKPLKVVICSDYLGTGAVEGSTSGFQSMINEWINQAGIEKNIQVVVYCLGTTRQQYNTFPNITFKQYTPNLSSRTFLPLIPPSIFPFLIDLLPIHPHIIKDIIDEKPDIIHTFQTFAATDVSGYIAAKIMKSRKKQVTLVNTIMGEADTYFGSCFQRIVSSFYKVMDSQSLLSILIESAYGGVYADKSTRKFSLAKFLFYINSGTYSYIFLKLFEILGILQDSLIQAVKFVLQFFLKQRYARLENQIRLHMNSLRKFPSASYYQTDSGYWLNYLAKPIQLFYDFVRRGDEKGPRLGIDGILANILRWCLGLQISAYVNKCDRVTISRPEDIIRYHIKAPVWEIPLGCDLAKFNVYEPSVNDFLDRVNHAVGLGTLASESANKLTEFVNNPEIASKKCIIYIGHLSDEKNISILIDACKQLLKYEEMKEKIHFLFVGAGSAISIINKQLGNSVTTTGLVPNHLLPDIYNFVRLRHGFFTNASDIETYGITHEEATACGLPLVAMEKGTRGRFYCPGDKIGDLKIDADRDVTQAIRDSLPDNWNSKLIFALNGLCIPDYSYGYSLSKLSTNCIAQELAKESLVTAMYSMAMLPNKVSQQMSDYASELAIVSKFGSNGTWDLLKTVYLEDWKSYHQLVQKKWHFNL